MPTRRLEEGVAREAWREGSGRKIKRVDAEHIVMGPIAYGRARTGVKIHTPRVRPADKASRGAGTRAFRKAARRSFDVVSHEMHGSQALYAIRVINHDRKAFRAVGNARPGEGGRNILSTAIACARMALRKKRPVREA